MPVIDGIRHGEPVIRIRRDADGLRLVVDPERIEYGPGGASILLHPLEEGWLATDIASAHQARVFEAAFKR